MGDLKLNGATSGTITVTPTAIAGTNTITLPASTGTVALTASPTFTGVTTESTITSPAATALTIQSAGTTAMTVGTNQNIGIGGAASSDTTYKWLTLTGPTTSGGGIVQVQNSDASVSANFFCNNLAGYIGTGSSHPLLFRINSSEVARFDSSGNLLIGATAWIGGYVSQLQLQGYNSTGGTGYHTFLSLSNTYGSATNPNKYFRLNSTGGIEIVNSAYNAVIMILSNNGDLTVGSRGISPASVPTGSIIQVTQTTWAAGSAYTAQSATNIDFTGFSATFTPLYSTSKVLIQLFAGVNGICDLNVYLKRNGTIIENSWFGSSRQDDQYDYPYVGAVLLDSPATTSTITYQIGGRAAGCGNYIRFGGSDSGSRIVFMEIAG
jgi:hypothetical protein